MYLELEPIIAKLSPDETTAVFEQNPELLVRSQTLRTALSEIELLIYHGDRGIGKTGIRNGVKRELRDEYYSPLIYSFQTNFRDVKKIVAEGITSGEIVDRKLAFQEAWTFDLVLKIARHIYDERQRRKTVFLGVNVDFGEYATLFRFLLQYDTLGKRYWGSRILLNANKLLNRVRSVKNITFTEATNPKNIHEVTESIKRLLIKNSLLVLVDQIDGIGRWDEEVFDAVIGLLSAAKAFTGKIAQEKKSIRFRIGIRNDYFAGIEGKYEDMQHFVRIPLKSDWTKENLMKLISFRILSAWNVTGRGSGKSEKILRERWEESGRKDLAENIFMLTKGETVINMVLPVLINKVSNAFDLLMTYALGKPRALFDIIREILEISVSRQSQYKLGVDAEYVAEPDVQRGIREYCSKLIVEFKASYETTHPGIIGVLNQIKKAQKIFEGTEFDSNELEKHVLKKFPRKNVFWQHSKSWPGYTGDDAKVVFDALFRLNVLGYVTGDQYVYHYHPGITKIPARIKKFVIHPLFQAAFWDYKWVEDGTNPAQEVTEALLNLSRLANKIREEAGLAILEDTAVPIKMVERNNNKENLYREQNIVFYFCSLLYFLYDARKKINCLFGLIQGLNTTKKIEDLKLLLTHFHSLNEIIVSLLEIGKDSSDALLVLMAYIYGPIAGDPKVFDELRESGDSFTQLAIGEIAKNVEEIVNNQSKFNKFIAKLDSLLVNIQNHTATVLSYLNP